MSFNGINLASEACLLTEKCLTGQLRIQERQHKDEIFGIWIKSQNCRNELKTEQEITTRTRYTIEIQLGSTYKYIQSTESVREGLPYSHHISYLVETAAAFDLLARTRQTIQTGEIPWRAVRDRLDIQSLWIIWTIRFLITSYHNCVQNWIHTCNLSPSRGFSNAYFMVGVATGIAYQLVASCGSCIPSSSSSSFISWTLPTATHYCSQR